jgi:hypothetical protein
MDLNFKKIYKAWITSYFPNETQKLLAEKRNEICEACPSRKVLIDKLKLGVVCGECGCPLTKKIFSNDFNDCPLKKWKEVDTIYQIFKSKSNKSLV